MKKCWLKFQHTTTYFAVVLLISDGDFEKSNFPAFTKKSNSGYNILQVFRTLTK